MDHELKCVNNAQYGAFVFRLTVGKKVVHFEAYSDGSGLKPIGLKYFTIEQVELIVIALKDKPNLELLRKRYQREERKRETAHQEFLKTL